MILFIVLTPKAPKQKSQAPPKKASSNGLFFAKRSRSAPLQSPLRLSLPRRISSCPAKELGWLVGCLVGFWNVCLRYFEIFEGVLWRLSWVCLNNWCLECFLYLSFLCVFLMFVSWRCSPLLFQMSFLSPGVAFLGTRLAMGQKYWVPKKPYR